MAGQVEIEARAYGPESTPEEIAAIQARLTVVDDNVVLWRELPVMSPFSVDVCYDRLEALCRAHGCRLALVDVRGGGRPDAAARKRIQQRVTRVDNQLVHVAIVVGANPLVRVAARFVQAGMPVRASIHATIEEGMEALRCVERG